MSTVAGDQRYCWPAGWAKQLGNQIAWQRGVRISVCSHHSLHSRGKPRVRWHFFILSLRQCLIIFTSRNDALLKALTDDIRSCALVLRKHRETLETVASTTAEASDTYWAWTPVTSNWVPTNHMNFERINNLHRSDWASRIFPTNFNLPIRWFLLWARPKMRWRSTNVLRKLQRNMLSLTHSPLFYILSTISKLLKPDTPR